MPRPRITTSKREQILAYVKQQYESTGNWPTRKALALAFGETPGICYGIIKEAKLATLTPQVVPGVGIAPDPLIESSDDAVTVNVAAELRMLEERAERLAEEAETAETDPLLARDLIVARQQILRTQRRFQSLQKVQRTAIAQADGYDRLIQAVRDTAHDFRSVSYVAPQPPRRNGKQRLDLIGIRTDWHAQEIIRPGTVNGVNAYGPRVFADRVQATTEQECQRIRMLAHYFDVWRYTAGLLGDMVTGVIHDMQRNQDGDPMSVAVNTAHVLYLSLVEVINTCHELGIEVQLAGVTGNHGRTKADTPMQDTTAPHDSFDWIIYALVHTRLMETHKIGIYTPDSLYALVQSNGLNFLLTHCDFLGKGSSPAQRLNNTRASLASALNIPIHGAFGGHFHMKDAHENCFITRSIKGTDGYVWTGFQNRGTPGQALYGVESNGGVIAFDLIADERTVTAPRFRFRATDLMGDPLDWDYRRQGPYVLGAAA